MAVLLGIGVVAGVVAADVFYRLMSRWHPPDPPVRMLDLDEYRRARRHRQALARGRARRPFNQNIE